MWKIVLGYLKKETAFLSLFADTAQYVHMIFFQNLRSIHNIQNYSKV